MAQEEAARILRRAIELDQENRFTESLICYQEGIQIALNVLKENASQTQAFKTNYRKKISEYMDRAELIKKKVETEKTRSEYQEHIQIVYNSVGHSYDTIFSRFLKESTCRRVDVFDPYIRSHHQIENFLRLCELLIKHNVKEINLTTGLHPQKDKAQDQIEKLDQIKTALGKHSVVLNLEFSDTLHDREIRLSNNWIVKIGRGLDYFQQSASRFSPGQFDFDLRPCLETTVDIYYKKL